MKTADILGLKFSDLHREAYGTCEQFAVDMTTLGVKLPLLPSQVEAGEVRDSRNRVIFNVDVHRDRSDAEVIAIACWIAMAVNTCAGFRAVPQDKQESR